MNISLTPELEKFVVMLVNNGMYASSSEVMREALRSLKDREEFRQKKLAELKADIEIGEESATKEKLITEAQLREHFKVLRAEWEHFHAKSEI